VPLAVMVALVVRALRVLPVTPAARVVPAVTVAPRQARSRVVPAVPVVLVVLASLVKTPPL
jgi:hypothetical protein